MFGADYSTLERMDQSNSQSEIHIRSVDASTSELDFGDDFEDNLKKVNTGLLTRVNSLSLCLSPSILQSLFINQFLHAFRRMKS